jgi:hypothetical protein
MKTQTRNLFTIAVLFTIASASCTRQTTIPVGVPTVINVPTLGVPTSGTQPVDAPAAPANGTFIDKNNFLAFDLPADWVHVSGTQSEYYTDTFTSPDGSAKIESLIYSDGQPFEPEKNKEFAMYLLNTYYSNTGKAGDINITADQPQANGSERYEWSSNGGGYSGVSLFELRGNDNTTFLMFTAKWTPATDLATVDVINKAIASFRIP